MPATVGRQGKAESGTGTTLRSCDMLVTVTGDYRQCKVCDGEQGAGVTHAAVAARGPKQGASPSPFPISRRDPKGGITTLNIIRSDVG